MSKPKIRLFKKHEGKYTKFEIFQIILLVYNMWSFFVVNVMNYLNYLWLENGYENAEVVRSQTYNMWSAVINWYVNGYTIILTYMIVSAILVFGLYTYILQKINKAKGLFARPGKLYLTFMSAVAAFTLLTLLNIIF